MCMCIMGLCSASVFFFFFNDTATTEIYTLSLHDALPISRLPDDPVSIYDRFTNLYDLMFRVNGYGRSVERYLRERSEEHTSELQSRQYLVCRLLLEKKKLHS